MTVFSQNNNGNSSKSNKENSFVEMHIGKMKQDITLTGDQEEKIRRLLKNLYKGREKAQKKNNPNSEKIAEKKASQLVFEIGQDSILTDEQKNILFGKSEQRKADVRNRINH